MGDVSSKQIGHFDMGKDSEKGTSFGTYVVVGFVFVTLIMAVLAHLAGRFI